MRLPEGVPLFLRVPVRRVPLSTGPESFTELNTAPSSAMLPVHAFIRALTKIREVYRKNKAYIPSTHS